jgi:hypothetical protein
MFKSLIVPIQSWLLAQGRCVACGESLVSGKTHLSGGKTIVTCRCGRMFVHNTKKNTFRRAFFDEI